MIDDLSKAALSKFNQNKNAQQFDNNLEPGTYPVDLTVTLLGTLNKDRDTSHNRRDTSGTKHMLRFLVDNCSTEVFDYLATNLTRIRSGKYGDQCFKQTEERMNILMPYRSIARKGNTLFHGDLIIEDYKPNSTAIPETTTGLSIISKM